MMLYKNTKAMVRSPDRNTNFLDSHWNFVKKSISTIIAYSLPRLRASIDLIKENNFKLKKGQYANDIQQKV